MEVTCAILSGGRSRRMGHDKATARVGGKTLVKHVYDVARRVFREIIVVSSLHRAFEGVEAAVVEDVLPWPGSLTGIVSALIHGGTPYVFVLGCDLPFVTEEAIRYTLGESRGEDITIPRTEGGFEPMHAIYGRSCISPMLTAIERREMKVSAIFPLLSVRVLLPNPVFFNRGMSVFTNVNTEEALKHAERLLL